MIACVFLSCACLPVMCVLVLSIFDVFVGCFCFACVFVVEDFLEVTDVKVQHVDQYAKVHCNVCGIFHRPYFSRRPRLLPPPIAGCILRRLHARVGDVLFVLMM